MEIRNALSRVIECVGIDKTAGIWDSVSKVVSYDQVLLDSSVVVICRERDEANPTNIIARKIARHQASRRPYGFEFKTCGNRECPGGSRGLDFLVENKGLDVKMTCRICLWESAWVPDKDFKEHFHKIPGGPLDVFWHSYPASPSLQLLFVSTT